MPIKKSSTQRPLSGMDILLAAAEKLRMAEINEFHARAGKIQKLHVKRKRGVFRCDKCPSVFGLRHNLLRHERTIHQGRRPFKCDFPDCTASFVQRFDLETHRTSVHDKRKDHQCDHCNRSFSQRSNLLTHVRLSHRSSASASDASPSVSPSPSTSDSSSLICIDCSKTFRTKHTLKRHIANHCPYSPSNSQSRSPMTSADMDDHFATSPSEVTHSTINPEPITPISKLAENDNENNANESIPLSFSSSDSCGQNSFDSTHNLPTLKPLPSHLSSQREQLE